MKPAITPIALGIMLFAGTVSADTIYQWIDESGTTQYSDTPPASGQYQEIVLDGSASGTGTSESQSPAPIPQPVEETPEERQFRENREREQNREKVQTCQFLAENIDTLRNKPFVMVHEDGSSESLPESQRGQKLAEWEAAYQEQECDSLEESE